MTGIMAGNIIATVPTIQTRRNEDTRTTFGALNRLAMVEMGREDD